MDSINQKPERKAKPNMIDTGDHIMIPQFNTKQKTVLEIDTLKQLIAGGVSGLVSRSLTAPLDRVKVLMQVTAMEKTSLNFLNTIVKIYQEGKILGFWRGNGVNCIKVVPEYAIRFSTYNKFKTFFSKEPSNPTFMEKFMSGSTAGLTAQVTIYPMEVLKTRMIVSKTCQYSGIFDAVFKIASNEGFMSFYRGLLPAVLGAVPYYGINLSLYETFKTWLKNVNYQNSNIEAAKIFGSSIVSAGFAQLVTYPLVLLRTNMQVYQRPYSVNPVNNLKYMIKLVKDIYLANGYKGFYKGLVPNFIKVAPSVFISFFTYEITIKKLNKYINN